jgi:hypothetical protein
MHDRDEIIYSSPSHLVTRSIWKGPRHLYALDDVDLVTIRRPLLLTCALVAFGLSALAQRFEDVLTGPERGALSAPLMLVAIASQIGCLKVHSLSLRNERVWGWHWRLKKVRDAIEVAMRDRATRARREEVGPR